MKLVNPAIIDSRSIFIYERNGYIRAGNHIPQHSDAIPQAYKVLQPRY